MSMDIVPRALVRHGSPGRIQEYLLEQPVQLFSANPALNHTLLQPPSIWEPLILNLQNGHSFVTAAHRALVQYQTMATKQILSPTSLEVGTALGSMERPIVKQSSIGLRTIRVLHQNEKFLSWILVSEVFRSGWHWCLEILNKRYERFWAYKCSGKSRSLWDQALPKITRRFWNIQELLLPAPSNGCCL